MKSLLVVRHAKSSWEWDDQNDFERPLNERGKRDAPLMAQRLVMAAAIPDLLVSSPAKRAKRTAQLFAKELGFDEEGILLKTELYHAPPEVFYEVIEKLDASKQTVAVFSHNPGITAFVNELTSTRLDNMPTCGVFGIRVEAESWEDFRNAAKTFWFFDYPKA
jgi:phosphohistidine phosphatase